MLWAFYLCMLVKIFSLCLKLSNYKSILWVNASDRNSNKIKIHKSKWHQCLYSYFILLHRDLHESDLSIFILLSIHLRLDTDTDFKKCNWDGYNMCMWVHACTCV